MTTYTQNSLFDAINELANQLIGHLKLEITVNPETETLEGNVKNKIYLIIREAVTNIKLHAEAKKAMVVIETHPNRIHLFIQDDGHGFSLKDITEDSLGLMRIKERIKTLGASLEMETSSETEGGVVYWIHIPLPIVSGEEEYREQTEISLAKKSKKRYIKEWHKMKHFMLE